MTKKLNQDTFWKIVVVVLLAIVGVQLWLTRTPTSATQPLTSVTPQPTTVQMPVPVVNNSSQPALKPIVSMRQQNNTPMIQVPQINSHGTAVTAPSARTAPGGVNPYDQPQLSSGRDMFRRMQAMAARMMQQMDMDMDMDMPTHLLGRSGGMRMTSPVVKSEKDNYVVQLNMPGLDKSNVKAKVNGNMLTISGVQTRENRKSNQGGNYYSSSSSHFQTSLALPGPVKTDRMKVDYNNNVLKVILPKA